MYDFSDRVVVITGGASGIGAEMVKSFAHQKATVVFCDIDQENGLLLKDKVIQETKNEHIHFVHADLSRKKDVKKFTKVILENFSYIDTLINNVGVNYQEGKFIELDLGLYEKGFEINVLSTIIVTKELIPKMGKKRESSIINISSTMSIGTINNLAYSSSKGYINTMTKSLALECAQENIRVNAIAPGIIHTKATEEWISEQKDPALVKGVPMGKVGKPEDIANVALFLASDMASYITGQILFVDGGLTVGE